MNPNLEPSVMNTPLEEPVVDSLAELMSRDPCSLSDQDIEKVVEILRERRTKWQEAETKPKKQKTTPFTLEDLDLA